MGDVVEEKQFPGVRRRRVITEYNAHRKCVMDYSVQRPNICAPCGREERVRDLSRSTKWRPSMLSQLLAEIRCCPEHSHDGFEVDRTPSTVMKQDPGDTVARMREKCLESAPPGTPHPQADAQENRQ